MLSKRFKLPSCPTAERSLQENFASWSGGLRPYSRALTTAAQCVRGDSQKGTEWGHVECSTLVTFVHTLYSARRHPQDVLIVQTSIVLTYTTVGVFTLLQLGVDDDHGTADVVLLLLLRLLLEEWRQTELVLVPWQAPTILSKRGPELTITEVLY